MNDTLRQEAQQEAQQEVNSPGYSGFTGRCEEEKQTPSLLNRARNTYVDEPNEAQTLS